MYRPIGLVLLLLAVPLAALPLVPAPAPAQGPPPAAAPQKEPLADQVRAALDRGVQHLRAKQSGGNWEGNLTHPGGYTALAVLALLNCGVPADDPAVKQALDHLAGLTPRTTYAASLMTMAFAQAGRPADKARIQALVDWLLEARQADGWSYFKGENARPDGSNTQFALLALDEARRAGAAVKPDALAKLRQTYLDAQSKADGSWGYSTSAEGRGGRVTMTTAGVCGLLITGRDPADARARLRDDGSAEKCGTYDDDAAVRKGLRWVGDRFPPALTRDTARALSGAGGTAGATYYALYGLERMGRLSGRRYLGEHDWYRVGCEFLVAEQNADGGWRGAALGEGSPVVATSMALLFLSKGRTPILVSKLAYGPADSEGWNNKWHDARHLTEFAAATLFKRQPLGWQVFDVRRVKADTAAAREDLAQALLQSPVVWFNGHDDVPRGREEEILKHYVENGGTIIAEACCGKERSAKFHREFGDLMTRLFGAGALEDLGPDHPVWSASGKFRSVPGDPFPLQGVKVGCKTVVFYSPKPIAGYWEANDTTSPKGKAAFELGANIIAYATGLEPPKPKLTEADLFRESAVRPAAKRGYLRVEQLQHAGDWQPARKAMRNLMAEAQKAGLDVLVEAPQGVKPTSENVLDYAFLYMHGRGQFEYTADGLKDLRFALLSHKTLLFADACCGSETFDKHFRVFVDRLFAEKGLKLEPIPETDELYSRELNGTAITRVMCRRRGRDGVAETERRAVAPALEGVKYSGRWVVIYSKYDIGCALEKGSAADCLGHDYDSALRLGKAAVLYALKR